MNTYTGVLGLCSDSIIESNNFADTLEHAVYNYGPNSKIAKNISLRNIAASSYQSLAIFDKLIDNEAIDCFAGIGMTGQGELRGNTITRADLFAISWRKLPTDPTTAVYRDLVLVGNVMSSHGLQPCLDIAMENRVIGFDMVNNSIVYSGIDTTNGATRLEGVGVDGSIEQFLIDGMRVEGSPIYAMNLKKFKNGKVTNCRAFNVNASIADVAYRMFNCTNVEFTGNAANDSRVTKKTNTILFASTGDGNTNINAHHNTGEDLGITTALCVVPNDCNPISNGSNGKGNLEVFSADNAATQTITTGVAESIRPQSLVILVPANATAMLIQRGVDYVEVKTVGAATVTIGTNSGNPIGTTGAIFKMEVIS